MEVELTEEITDELFYGNQEFRDRLATSALPVKFDWGKLWE